jgi:hypothetical protein
MPGEQKLARNVARHHTGGRNRKNPPDGLGGRIHPETRVARRESKISIFLKDHKNLPELSLSGVRVAELFYLRGTDCP